MAANNYGGALNMAKLSMEDYLNTQDTVQDQIDDLIFGLIKARKKSNLTQIKLSQITGIPQTTISRIESFSTTPTLPILMKMANALNLSIILSKHI